MEASEIRAKIESFSRWHYQFDLDGQITPIRPPERANSHIQRKRYFFEPLVELCGGSLEGKRVLDLGCNAGYWALEALDRGADYVLGIDGRQMHIDQANFVFDVKGVERKRYDFLLADVFDFDYESHGNFDIVLCLGLMYHISKPVELMETMARANDDLIVVDTLVSIAPGSYLRIRSEDLENPIHAADRELVMSPTRKAVLDLAEAFGYAGVILKPNFDDYTHAKNYRQGRRRAFLLAKKTPLTGLKAPTEQLGVKTRARDYVWLARDNAKNIPKRLLRKLRS